MAHLLCRHEEGMEADSVQGMPFCSLWHGLVSGGAAALWPHSGYGTWRWQLSTGQRQRLGLALDLSCYSPSVRNCMRADFNLFWWGRHCEMDRTRGEGIIRSGHLGKAPQDQHVALTQLFIPAPMPQASGMPAAKQGCLIWSL